MKLRTDLPFAWRVRAGMTALVIPILILIVPLNRLSRWLGRPFGKSAPPPDVTAAEWIDQLLHRLPWPWKHTCLRRCAVLYHLLRRGGQPVQLVVGVRRDEYGKLAAHAWLTLDETPYLEPGDEVGHEFRTIAQFPEAAVCGQ